MAFRLDNQLNLRRSLCFFIGVMFSLTAVANDPLYNATRLSQAEKDLPGTVTIITSQQIKERGYQSLSEIFMDVPGMRVSYAGSRYQHVSYHGGSGAHPRRLQVAIDGTIVQTGDLRGIQWARLPISLDEIHEVVVYRGTNVGPFAGNAFQGSINFVRKEFVDLTEHTINATVGSAETGELNYQYANTLGEHTEYVLNLSHRQTDGTDTKLNDDGSVYGDYEDDIEVQHISWRSSSALNDSTRLLLNLNAYEAETAALKTTNPLFPSFDETPREYSGHFIQAKIQHDITERDALDFSIQYVEDLEEWRSGFTLPTAWFLQSINDLAVINPAMAANLGRNRPLGSTPTAAEAALIAQYQADLFAIGFPAAFTPLRNYTELNRESNQTSFNVDYQFDRPEIGLQGSIAGDVEQLESISSSYFSQGPIKYDVQRISSHLEYRDRNSSFYTLNFSAIAENNDAVDDVEYGGRVGLNLHLTNTDTLKFVVSDNFRMPTTVEQDRYYLSNTQIIEPTPAGAVFDEQTFARTFSTNDLEPERIFSKEISWLHYAGSVNSELKVFHDEISNVIVDPVFLLDGHIPYNGDKYTVSGAEGSVNWHINRDWSVRAQASYIDNDSDIIYQYFDERIDYERTLHADWSGSLGVTKLYDSGASTTLSYYGTSEVAGWSYDRLDLNIVKPVGVVPGLSLSLLVRANLNVESGMNGSWESGANAGRFDDDYHAFLTVKYER